MKTTLQVLKEINDLPSLFLETEGVRILNEYVELVSNRIAIADITDRLLPYASEALKAILRAPVQTKLPDGGKVAFMGVTVERTIFEKSTNKVENLVLESEYHRFAELLSKALELKLFRGPLLATFPFRCAMAIISPSRRFMLCMYCETDHDFVLLRDYSKLFNHEGELPALISEIIL